MSERKIYWIDIKGCVVDVKPTNVEKPIAIVAIVNLSIEGKSESSTQDERENLWFKSEGTWGTGHS